MKIYLRKFYIPLEDSYRNKGLLKFIEIFDDRNNHSNSLFERGD
jgi:hypothetical protein